MGADEKEGEIRFDGCSHLRLPIRSSQRVENDSGTPRATEAQELFQFVFLCKFILLKKSITATMRLVPV
ncbi:MAG: hypothetical protein WAM70_13220, partial [Pyrinomonadaceae bacterium]